ncbi:MAG: aminodeoxychorismate lyase [Chromatiales bacterium]
MLIDGEERDRVSARDRGFQYGDGLFETLSVEAGVPCLWDRHMARLDKGCRRLGIPMPDPRRLAAEADQEIGGAARGVLKIIVTRGQGGRGYRPPETPRALRVVEFGRGPSHPESWKTRGICVRRCSTRLSRNPATAGIKHLNRLEQVLARAEWTDPDVAEGLMLDTADQLIEGTMTNLFLVDDQGIATPDLSQCGVAGVMRQLVMDLARSQGIPAEVRPLGWGDLERARGIFLTNSVVGAWPVRDLAGHAIDTRALPLGLLRAVRERGLTP